MLKFICLFNTDRFGLPLKIFFFFFFCKWRGSLKKASDRNCDYETKTNNYKGQRYLNRLFNIWIFIFFHLNGQFNLPLTGFGNCSLFVNSACKLPHRTSKMIKMSVWNLKAALEQYRCLNSQIIVCFSSFPPIGKAENHSFFIPELMLALAAVFRFTAI